MRTGEDYTFLEITATVYEVAEIIFLTGDPELSDRCYIDHDMIILPEPMRIYDRWYKNRFDFSTEYYEDYGDIRETHNYFTTKIPMIGIDTRHITQGFYSTDIHGLTALDIEFADRGVEIFHDMMPNILAEIDKEIDKILPRLPIKNRWGKIAKSHRFRFVIALEHVYEKHYVYDAWTYEYDAYINWLGRVDVAKICEALIDKE